MRYTQPFRLNATSELDTGNPVRQPFMDWISNNAFNLKDERLSKVYGNSVIVPVPCGAFDL